MSPYPLVISPAAQNDLKDIYRFGLRNRGQSQSSQYFDILKENIWTLTEQPLMGIEHPELLAGMRSLPVESHVLFYRVQSSKVEIIRILHYRQDPDRHIK